MNPLDEKERFADEADRVELLLPYIGITVGTDNPGPCPIPGHTGQARFVMQGMRSECVTCVTRERLSPPELYAARGYGGVEALSRTALAMWWQKLIFDSGHLRLDLPALDLEPSKGRTALLGLVVLTAIQLESENLTAPDYSLRFASAWCRNWQYIPWRTMGRVLGALERERYVTRVRVPRNGSPRPHVPGCRYGLTGKGLVITTDAHRELLRSQ